MALNTVGYQSCNIRISEMTNIFLQNKDHSKAENETLNGKIKAGNDVRELYDSAEIFGLAAILRIREERAAHNKVSASYDRLDGDFNNAKAQGLAYIVRQFKRPEEIDLMRRIYGKNFIQVSVTESNTRREEAIRSIMRSDHPAATEENISDLAINIIRRDQNEQSVKYGQRLNKIFHLGDAFITCDPSSKPEAQTVRFVKSLFGRNDISPTMDEFGSFMAKAASMRSVDLSRQVGAAILTSSGDMISVGCNEVPKKGGGNYWDDDPDKTRDIDKGTEANKVEINRIVHDFLRVLSENNELREGATVDTILGDTKVQDEISNSLIGGLTEYGRMVHAEMNALSDAARLGRSVDNSTMYVTTFPCHNCAKHIIASGISKVVFIEPYPKSKANQFYAELIGENPTENEKIQFEHFSGISPRRYVDFFEKGSRRGHDGKIQDWYKGAASPRIGPQETDYPTNEALAIKDVIPLSS